MKEIKYQYAFDETGKLVSINDYTKETARQHTFRCVSCGHQLLPRAIGSKARRAHFYHKELVECSGETYLHKLAKTLLLRKFYESPEFLIEYHVTKVCNQRNCRLKSENCTLSNTKERFDLKQYYDTCTEEVNVNGFVADLLLSNSNNPQIPNVLIEICVTHACEEDKLSSGLKIIEINVRNEDDINSIVDKGVITEDDCYGQNKKKQISFFSFKKQFEVPMESDISRFIFDPVNVENGYLTSVSCKNANYKLLKNSQFELNIVDPNNIILYHAYQWIALYKHIKRCNLCKFYYYSICEDSACCCLSKKYGLPKHPNMSDAETCKKYTVAVDMDNDRFCNSFIEEVISPPINEKEVFRVIIAGSSSFGNKDVFKEKCDYFLGQLFANYTIIVLSGTSYPTKRFIEEYAKENSLIVEPHEANWVKYSQNAGIISSEEMLRTANALIAFWDGRGTNTGFLIEAAKAKGIKVAVVRY